MYTWHVPRSIGTRIYLCNFIELFKFKHIYINLNVISHHYSLYLKNDLLPMRHVIKKRDEILWTGKVKTRKIVSINDLKAMYFIRRHVIFQKLFWAQFSLSVCHSVCTFSIWKNLEAFPFYTYLSIMENKLRIDELINCLL